ncbi:dTDP-4-dehydrorhamnose 3,5-epimerase family protein [uncultured Methanolobus sp.]|uniref:dTDP-4-dehydrorhamnose 3,5-epimerase family protein n=1 Tax=uncultured Methanolobus sp. TaxID=218300 RepID=UPI0029C90567|nr:dTDP-4-dehydrorhamnose 3,5-epimerase family protein [uncultured Methanolobus sp.]
MLEGVKLTPLKIITGEQGDVMHAMKCTDPEFSGFGEAYFSTVKQGSVKAWKCHKKMALNLVVPCGRIKFVLWDGRQDSPTYSCFYEIVLSPENYHRLTVPPMVWVGFQGMEKGLNILMNLADILHDPDETERLEINNDRINYKWDDL